MTRQAGDVAAIPLPGGGPVEELRLPDSVHSLGLGSPARVRAGDLGRRITWC